MRKNRSEGKMKEKTERTFFRILRKGDKKKVAPITGRSGL